MVQVIQSPRDPRDLALGNFSSELGQGIGSGLNSYFANKALEDVSKDPSTKNLSLSEKLGALQSAVAPYGEKGQKMLQQRMQYMEQEHQRGQLQQALSKIKESTGEGGSNLDTVLSSLEAIAGIPGGERMAGQILPLILQNANAQRLYGQVQQNQIRKQSLPGFQATQNPQQQQLQQQEQTSNDYNQLQGMKQQVRPTGYNIQTPEQMDIEAREAAQLTGDPGAYSRILAEKEAKNTLAKNHRAYLEEIAQSSGSVSKEDLPYFMEVGETVPSDNPDQWFQQTANKWAQVNNDFKKLNDAFIPGIQNALMGENREKSLKQLEPTVQDMKRKGYERQAREFLNKNYLSHTEVEALVNPIGEKVEKNLENIPKGLFPSSKRTSWKDVPNILQGKKDLERTPFVDYETALEKSPKTMQTMQNRLANFFEKNVTPDTSLLVLRDKLWKDKDYDWRQIGPAIEQAKKNGLKLSPNQESELTDLSTNPPIQSLPDIFRSWDRPAKYIRGNK